MADIIEFGNPKVMRLQKDLKLRDEELAAVREQLVQSQKQAGQLSAVNDMLKIQLIELVGKLEALNLTVLQTVNNLKTLQSKLPDIQ